MFTFNVIFALVYVITVNATDLNEGYIWSTWSEWSAKCPRNCTDSLGIQNRTRECLFCSNLDCTAVNSELCKFLGITRSVEYKYCYNGAYCNGIGEYTGEYGDWKVNSTCQVREGCHEPGVRTVYRECIATKKTRELANTYLLNDFKCNDLKGEGIVKSEDCQIDCAETGLAYFYWSPWGEWICTSECKNNSSITAIRKRSCTYGLNRVTSDEYIKYCKVRSNEGDVEKGSCDHCYKKWGEWSSWSKCTELCESPGRNRTRNCTGFGKDCKCETKFYKEGCEVDWIDCEDINRMNFCPTVNGNWGDWSNWGACSVTCGFGIVKRHRYCNNPAPTFKGIRCTGLDFDLRHCYSNVMCPVDGQWSEWSQWTCNKKCSENAYQYRFRGCDDPVPLFNGKQCEGLAREETNCTVTMDDCDLDDEPGFLPRYLRKLLEKYLSNLTNSHVVNEDERLELNCKSDAKRQIENYLSNNNPGARFNKTWFHNGKWLVKRDNVKHKKYIADQKSVNLIIEGALPVDAGVHVCTIAIPVSDQNIIVNFHTIAVKIRDGLYDYEDFAGNKLNIPCNSILLGQLFRNLSETWYYKENELSAERILQRTYNTKLFYMSPNLFFYKLKLEDTGIYECRVKDNINNREWITNRVKLRVKSVQSILYNIDLWIFLGLALVTFIIVFVIYVCIRYHKYKKLEDNFEREDPNELLKN